MSGYFHSQTGALMIFVLGGTALALAVGAALGGPAAVLWLAAALLALAAVMFSSLTVELTPAELTWRFGPGFIRKQIALSDIAKVSVVRTKWYEGWGIHYTARGWLYNVSGSDAVAIELRDGKRFMLGTDEPRRLAQAIERRIAD